MGATAAAEVCFGGGAAAAARAGAGSGVDQASFEPHASMLLKLLKPLDDIAGGFVEAGLLRLKAEALYEGAEGVGFGAAAGVMSDPMSKRSPIEEAGGGGGDLVADGAADVKSPKSPNPLDVRCTVGFGGGGGFDLATGAGLLSKKLPPPKLESGEATEERGEARPANGDGFTACCCRGGEEKLNPPNASPIPARDCE